MLLPLLRVGFPFLFQKRPRKKARTPPLKIQQPTKKNLRTAVHPQVGGPPESWGPFREVGSLLVRIVGIVCLRVVLQFWLALWPGWAFVTVPLRLALWPGWAFVTVPLRLALWPGWAFVRVL